jgi:hypothetical protein
MRNTVKLNLCLESVNGGKKKGEKNSTALRWFLPAKYKGKSPSWELMIITKPVEKFPTFYKIRKFITVFKTSRHCSYPEPV